jgi:8-oxo-dGTP pyrophosphatase MutT (NUDIX family)
MAAADPTAYRARPMPGLAFTHVEVYLFSRRPAPRLLLLRRSAGRSLPGVWQPVTGHRRRGERGLAAARREVREETGLVPGRWWSLEAPALLYDARTDRAGVLPIFVAEVPAGARIALSPEHDASRYCSLRQAATLVLWDAQRAAIGALASQILGNPRLAAALEITARPPR